MQLSPNFCNDLAGRPFTRAQFQFTASGTEQSGVLYVTAPLGTDVMASAALAARKVAKRAGCPLADVTLHRIMAPRA